MSRLTTYIIADTYRDASIHAGRLVLMPEEWIYLFSLTQMRDFTRDTTVVCCPSARRRFNVGELLIEARRIGIEIKETPLKAGHVNGIGQATAATPARTMPAGF